jgi:hypothetical protein
VVIFVIVMDIAIFNGGWKGFALCPREFLGRGMTHSGETWWRD